MPDVTGARFSAAVADDHEFVRSGLYVKTPKSKMGCFPTIVEESERRRYCTRSQQT